MTLPTLKDFQHFSFKKLKIFFRKRFSVIRPSLTNERLLLVAEILRHSSRRSAAKAVYTKSKLIFFLEPILKYCLVQNQPKNDF